MASILEELDARRSRASIDTVSGFGVDPQTEQVPNDERQNGFVTISVLRSSWICSYRVELFDGRLVSHEDLKGVVRENKGRRNVSEKPF